MYQQYVNRKAEAKATMATVMGKRTYEQFCGLAQALDLVGERWTLLLVRDLSLGPQRFTDIQAGLPGIGTGRLTERLRHLEGLGVVRRTQLPPPPCAAACPSSGWCSASCQTAARRASRSASLRLAGGAPAQANSLATRCSISLTGVGTPCRRPRRTILPLR